MIDIILNSRTLLNMIQIIRHLHVWSYTHLCCSSEIFQGFSHHIAFIRLSPPYEKPRVGGLEIFDYERNRPGGMAAESHLDCRQGVRHRRRGLIREADSQRSDTILPQVPSLNYPFIELPFSIFIPQTLILIFGVSGAS